MNNTPSSTRLAGLTLESALLSSHGVSAAKVRAFHRWVLETDRTHKVQKLLLEERRGELRLLLKNPPEKEEEIQALEDEWFVVCGRIGEIEEDLKLLSHYYLNAAIDRFECTLEARNPAIGELWPMFMADSGLIPEPEHPPL